MDAARFKFSQRTGRFYENHDSDFDVNFNENKNTKRKTETDMRIFASYLVSIDETREPETIPADELDRHLATYFSVIKKHDGNEYEPASLRGMLCSIERYLRSKNYPVSLTRDAEFTNTRNMLKERQKLLRDLAKTDKSTKSDAIAVNTVHRLNQLYLAKEFGPHNPSAVINALCFAFVVHLKIRKAIDHKQLLWGDIVLKSSSTSDEYLCYEPLQGYEYCRLPLKDISGYRVLAQSPENSLWDPISIYKLYRHKRPANMMAPDSPFYLGIFVPMHDSQQQPWYRPVAMGVNKLNDLVRMIRDITGTLVHGPSYTFDTFDVTDTGDTDTSFKSSVPYRHGVENADSKVRSNAQDATRVPVEDKINDEINAIRGLENATDNNFHQEDKGDTYLADESGSNISENDSENTTEADSLVVDAKKKILLVLDNLGFDAKIDVIRWLKTNVCLSDSESDGGEKGQEESRKRIRLSFELDGAELKNLSTLKKTVKVQIVPAESDGTKLKSDLYDRACMTELVSDKDEALNSKRHDPVSALSEITEDKSDESTFYDQSDSLHRMRQYVFKRALSYPLDFNNAKVPKTKETDGQKDTCTPPNQFQASMPSISERQNANFDNNVQCATHDVTDAVTDHVHPVQGYNPYAAWPIDPRFAMFLRNGFMQTYQDFVNMYSNPEAKDISNK